MSSAGKTTLDKKLSRMENFFQRQSPSEGKSNKRSNSGLSPIDKDQTTKKPNITNKETNGANITSKDMETEGSMLKEIIGPLIDEVKLLRESFHSDLEKMDNKIENAISTHQEDIASLKETLDRSGTVGHISTKIEVNTTNINFLLEENKRLHRENMDL